MIVLETARLFFRDHTPEDLDPFCALEADPEVSRFVGGRPRTREGAEHRFRNSFLRFVPDRLCLWATVFKPDDRYIGDRPPGLLPLRAQVLPQFAAVDRKAVDFLKH